jgi:23S rRNA (uracil1939-C5)-methyltransferase
MGIKRVVYVSCGPETLARDLKIFKDFGYEIKNARCVDMFPRTEHVESVCLLSKVEK